ncbi:formate dehydrogenase accessory protein FdhE [Thiobacter aerophilum]|uniref:Protein FdhE homolog n=1 Tax=Thiobacter aerophilum TaxID=3121275 RepID=A0ABV0EFL6_9BURK
MTGILQPGHIEPPVGDLPRLRLAPESLFADRAARFRQLAAGHSLEPFLHFLGALAAAQHSARAHLPAPSLPPSTTLEQVRAHHMPPLAPAGITLDAHWRTLARRLAAATVDSLPAAGQSAALALADAEDAALDQAAQAFLAQRPQALPAAWVPFVAAALEVYWVHLAASLAGELDGLAEPATLCPVCGAPPVSAMLQIGGVEQGLRYLHCSRCNSEWHFVRAQCSNCGDARELAYYSIEGRMPWVDAEACGHCGSYLKLIRREKDPQADALADDVASLALDLLMDEKGFSRSGPNPYLIAT